MIDERVCECVYTWACVSACVGERQENWQVGRERESERKMEREREGATEEQSEEEEEEEDEEKEESTKNWWHVFKHQAHLAENTERHSVGLRVQMSGLRLFIAHLIKPCTVPLSRCLPFCFSHDPLFHPLVLPYLSLFLSLSLSFSLFHSRQIFLSHSPSLTPLLFPCLPSPPRYPQQASH